MDQYEEDREYELNARYDYLQEAYGDTAIDAGWDDAPPYTPEEELAYALLAGPYFPTVEQEERWPF